MTAHNIMVKLIGIAARAKYIRTCMRIDWTRQLDQQVWRYKTCMGVLDFKRKRRQVEAPDPHT